MAKKSEDSGIRFSTKKCYNCLEHLPLEATTCTNCKKKVGKINRIGMASKPIDWIAYLVCAIAFAALAAFILKAF